MITCPLPPLYNVGRSQPSHNIVSGGRGGSEYLETIHMGWSYFQCKTLYFLTCPAKRVYTYMTHFQQFFCCLSRSGAWRRREPVRNIAKKSKITPPRYPPSRLRCPTPQSHGITTVTTVTNFLRWNWNKSENSYHHGNNGSIVTVVTVKTVFPHGNNGNNGNKVTVVTVGKHGFHGNNGNTTVTKKFSIQNDGNNGNNFFIKDLGYYSL